MKRHSQLGGILIGSGMLFLAPQAVWSASTNADSPMASLTTVDGISNSGIETTSDRTPDSSTPALASDTLLAPETTQGSEIRSTSLPLTSQPKLNFAGSQQWTFASSKRIAQAIPSGVMFPNPQTSVTTTPPPGLSSPGVPPVLGNTGTTSPSVRILDTSSNRSPLPTLSQGGMVNGVTPEMSVPPSMPRAVPPPVGDISVSTFGAFYGSIDLGTTQRIPRLILRDAPVREVLSLLARSAGMNVVFTNESKSKDPQQAAASGVSPDKEGPRISLDIENESIQDVFNYVLRVGGLQANRSGRTVFVGTQLPVEARNVIVRSLRLNQVNVVEAANFLSAQGAESQIPITRVTIQQVGTGLNARDVEIREPDIKAISAKEGAGTLLLSGLSIVADPRLNSITLIGDPRKVEMATGLLTQLDGRKRQVMVNVKIVDVNLLNLQSQNSSFSFKVGENFFSIDNGAALYNYGPSRPPTNSEAQASQFFVYPVVTGLNVSGTPGFFDFNPNAVLNGTGFSTISNPNDFYSRPAFGTSSNPFQPGVSQIQAGQVQISAPSLYRFPSQFLSQIQAQITAGNAKILTDPSLVVQEGQTAKVGLTQQVVGNIVSTTTSDGNLTTKSVTANIVNAGLELNVNVERIDDNGFVTLTVNPQVTSISGNVNISVDNNANQITLLNTRSVDSGRIRLRDGQTLVLSGIIQDQDRTDIRKVPILGDLPIIGTLFRSTSKTNARQEVIVLLTPQVLDDSDRATFGYGYNPSVEMQRALTKP